MRASQLLLATLKETPADAQIISHQLMLRAGMIRRLAAGLYTWLPLGLRVLRRVEQVVREEMDRAGAQEILMPAVQPAELWQESGRWDEYGPELLRIRDRHEREFCFGPTHEEVITDLIRRELRSYRHLPATFYQIQTKFRDEIRPRFGVMRAREFLMKDAYSFHQDEASLSATYELMHEAYCRIFNRLGLDFRAVRAPTGAIGGSLSHEFHVLAESGEDAIAVSTHGNYAANVELAETRPPATSRPAPRADLQLVDTPNAKTIQQLVEQFDVPVDKTIKTLVVAASDQIDSDFVALLVRGDHELNAHKAEQLPEVASPLRMANEDEIRAAVGVGPGSIGPVGLPLPCIIDYSVAVMADFAAGANSEDQHYFGINWQRDIPLPPRAADLRHVMEGDLSPDGHGTLTIKRGIEVGHVFQLGRKYSDAMGATCLDEQGHQVTMTMGCYGIGVSRVVAAAIEQNHDEHGIIWPNPIAPFHVTLVPMKMHKSKRLREAVDTLYQELGAAGLDVLLDDRNERPGVMFADMDLLGIPHRLVMSERGLDDGTLEYRHRRGGEIEHLPLETVVSVLKSRAGLAE